MEAHIEMYVDELEAAGRHDDYLEELDDRLGFIDDETKEQYPISPPFQDWWGGRKPAPEPLQLLPLVNESAVLGNGTRVGLNASDLEDG